MKNNDTEFSARLRQGKEILEKGIQGVYAENVSEEMRKQGITNTEFMKRLGKLTTYSSAKMLSAEPYMSSIMRVADKLDTTPGDLLTDRHPKTSDEKASLPVTETVMDTFSAAVRNGRFSDALSYAMPYLSYQEKLYMVFNLMMNAGMSADEITATLRRLSEKRQEAEA